MRIRETIIPIIIIIVAITTSLFVVGVINEQNPSPSESTQLIIESVYIGKREVSGNQLSITLNLISDHPFSMMSGPMLSCAFGIKLVNSSDWKLNDSQIANCPLITNRTYNTGSYTVILKDYVVPVGKNTQTYFLTKLEIEAVTPNIVSDPFLVVYEQ